MTQNHPTSSLVCTKFLKKNYYLKENIFLDDVDENIECISAKMLNTMSNDVAKLKAKHVLDLIPKNKLTLLINYAMRNVYLAKNYSAGPVSKFVLL